MCRRANIVLIGFMGTGKSSAGKMAADSAGYSFIETDYEIENYLNIRINDVFTMHGEDYFRAVETFICTNICKKENSIISTGGGIIKRKENIECLRQNGKIIYLSAQPEHIYNNLKNASDRPLLNNTTGADRLAVIKRLLTERRKAYEEFADAEIDVTGKSIKDISNEIIILGGTK